MAEEQKRGRPESTPDTLSQYTRRNFSAPAHGWKLFDKFAEKMNARSRSGPRFGKFSWRSLLLRIILEDAPRIIRQIEELGYTPYHEDRFHLSLDKTRLPRMEDGSAVRGDIITEHSLRPRTKSNAHLPKNDLRP